MKLIEALRLVIHNEDIEVCSTGKYARTIFKGADNPLINMEIRFADWEVKQITACGESNIRIILSDNIPEYDIYNEIGLTDEPINKEG